MGQTGAVAEITVVKGETAALDRTWLTLPGSPGWQAAVHVVHDLPHLVVESAFGLPDGLWGVLAQGGFAAANRSRTRRRGRRARLVTDLPLDGLAARNWTGHRVAKERVTRLLERLDDATIALAIAGTRYLSATWAALPPGGTLRLSWPLSRAALSAGTATAG
jgi:hypothetical protein